jgi:hypothetical protein
VQPSFLHEVINAQAKRTIPAWNSGTKVWVSYAVPGAAPSSAVFGRRHDRDFRGLLLLVGLFTRPFAFALSGEMAVAYFKFHAPQGFWPLLNEGEGAVLYCFIFLFLASAGGGPWSFDRLLRKRASTVY